MSATEESLLRGILEELKKTNKLLKEIQHTTDAIERNR